jgi:glycosyltransferase involved in cell wall biosynthesis
MPMCAHPTVCLGLPLYNQTDYLTAALDSLLVQTYRDFELIVVDDSTLEAPGAIARRYARADGRIRYVRNPARKGMVDNWKCCFAHAAHADYFAWVSDHDIWHPEWLATLVGTLETHPGLVLVYPSFAQINADGSLCARKRPRPFSTDGLGAARRALAVCLDARYFGKLVYGLYRTSALRSAGVFRRVLFPDVVLLLELSLHGDFRQVDAQLWSLRRLADFSIARQKRTLFVTRPWYIHLPWPLVNAAVLAWNTALRPGAGAVRKRCLGLMIAVLYLARWVGKLGEGGRIGSYREWKKGRAPWMKHLLRYTRTLRTKFWPASAGRVR